MNCHAESVAVTVDKNEKLKLAFYLSLSGLTAAHIEEKLVQYLKANGCLRGGSGGWPIWSFHPVWAWAARRTGEGDTTCVAPIDVQLAGPFYGPLTKGQPPMQHTSPCDFIDAATAQSITKNTFLSREEAAKYLGLSAKTLATHLKDGPRYYKLFGSVRYNLQDLDSWARQQVVVR